jgi:hypothetical protein
MKSDHPFADGDTKNEYDKEEVKLTDEVENK